jgi:hypothetical protein
MKTNEKRTPTSNFQSTMEPFIKETDGKDN